MNELITFGIVVIIAIFLTFIGSKSLIAYFGLLFIGSATVLILILFDCWPYHTDHPALVLFFSGSMAVFSLIRIFDEYFEKKGGEK